MRQIRNGLLLICLILLLPLIASAQTGKIRGVVTDKISGETIIGANVIISGTTRGAATNIDGEYIIIGLPPGRYSVEISYLGYKKVAINDILVRIDLTTTTDIALEEETFQGEELTVVAERALIQKDVTASLASVGREQIQAIPVESLSEVIGLQAGVVDGHFRGGRAGEVGYWVDGIPVTDVFNGGVGQNIENNSVQEVQVVTGAFAAEYGQAMSGIVNIVTRDGSNDFTGGFMTFEGDYVSSRKDLFLNIEKINPISVRNFEANIEGPIIKDKLFFFASGRYFSNDGWLYGKNKFTSDDVGIDNSGGIILLDTLGSGNDKIVSMNPYGRMSGQFKLTWRMTSNIKISFNTLIGSETFKGYNQSAIFFPAFQNDEFNNSRSSYLKMTHTLSNRTFYDISVSNNLNTYKTYAFEDALSENYKRNEYAGYRSADYFNFLVGGTNNGRFNRSTSTWLYKFDITSQVNNQNQLKAGVELRSHRLKYNSQTVQVIDDNSAPFIFVEGEYDRKPFEISSYLQDKIEIGSLIINVGVRFDYFDANGQLFSNPTDRQVVFPNLRDEYVGDLFVDSKPTYQFSPRLGIAFPISAGGVIHFSYGHFFQIPNFELLYQNPAFRLGTSGSGLIGLIGNANLQAQKTVNGEIGLKQELNSSSAIEITAFFRDIRNLAGTQTDPITIDGTSARYGKIQNSDFGFIKGVILAYDQSIGNGFNIGADYTFQVAKGNSSDPSQAFNAAAAKQQLETQIVPLNWDQLHTINLTSSYAAQTWGFGTVMTYGSGFPYTPVQTTLQTGTIQTTVIALNSQRKPSTFRMDMNIYKNFKIGKNSMQVFALVDNLLDIGNENGVYGDTGRATYSLQKRVDASTFRGDPYYIDSWYNRPDFYNEPRRVTLGLRYNF